ncbi:D-alanyl-D-alanine carboxypeptidase family protein [Bulleidia sp. zg-1006]|uniref:D-alanyl-D-alanine carboxypeptidase family protein n=1 Tax=Bulleidia sp. zg-1006 TaxID=2806552 RepID=UPI001939722B|nr:D-alanyl-D-alanine carboxypeptidase [Bulleidia sp. zg-1006]QRG86539.1 D-alanyl-D-alanine carboxypeptidase [Bulleidia sp. zg-1006]
MFETLLKLSLSTILSFSLVSYPKKIGLFHGTQSSHYLLMDLNNDEILEKKKGSEKIYPASLTKMMVVYVALNHIQDNQKTAVISPKLLNKLSSQGAATSKYPVNTPITYEDLLYGIALPSGADCSVTLAHALFHNSNGFVKEMNSTAKKLGMNHSHFDNVTGLHSPNHYTTLKDLSIFLKVALKNANFQKYFSAMTYKSKVGITLYHTLYRNIQKTGLRLPGYQGSKTGYTAQAGHCLALWFQQGGHRYLYLASGGPGGIYISSHLSDAHLIVTRLARAKKETLGPFIFLGNAPQDPFFLYCQIKNRVDHLFQKGH